MRHAVWGGWFGLFLMALALPAGAEETTGTVADVSVATEAAEPSVPAAPAATTPSAAAPAAPSATTAPAAPDAETERLRLRLEIEKTRLEAERLKAQNAAAVRPATTTATKPAARPVAKPHVPIPGEHEHDGFFLRFGFEFGLGGYAGKGIANLSYGKYHDPKGSGMVTGGELLVGQAVIRNLVLHGLVAGSSSSCAENQDLGPDRELDRLIVGGGATYYFMPYNIYVTGNLGFVEQWLRERSEGEYDDNGDGDLEHLPGLGLQASIGKEWWVSPNWGVGLALLGEYDYGHNGRLTLHAGSGRLVLGATFN